MTHSKKRSSILGRLVLTTAATLFCAAGAQANDYTVELNKTQLLRLPTAAAAVIIGNPEIADVSVHSQDTIFIMGRGYGTTNMIILDAAGQTVLDTNLHVTGSRAANDVQILKGSDRETYLCAPQCSPAPVLGDEQAFVAQFSATATPVNNAVASQFSGGLSAPSSSSGFSSNSSSRPTSLSGGNSRPAPLSGPSGLPSGPGSMGAQ